MSGGGGDRSGAPLAPFDARLDFFAGASHHEALARLEYLVETGLRCGLVIGPKGTGKSTVLRVFVEEASAAHFSHVLVDLTALRGADALQRLSQGLGITSHARGRLSVLWQEVADALAGQRHAKHPCVVIFDHLDRALPDCQQVVQRLLSQDAHPCAATFVLAFSGLPFPVIAREWRQAADLRIELAPLTADETAAFVESLLVALELPKDAFDAAATEILFRMTHGVPRDVVRLCELSLLSAMQDDKQPISGDVVEAAMRELSLLRSSA